MRLADPPRAALAALMLAAALSSCLASAEASAATRECGNIIFTPHTEDGAFDIRANGVSCRTARRVARGANDRGPKGADGATYTYTRLRFRCRGIERDEPIPVVQWRCRRAAATISFEKA